MLFQLSIFKSVYIMVTKYLTIVAFLLISLCFSCQRHRVVKIENEFVFKNPTYKLDYKLDEKGARLIDTAAVYVYTETESSFGLTYRCLKFDKYGRVIRLTKFYKLLLIEKDFQIHPKSVDRGMYELLDNNRIKLELYYAGEPVPFTNGWLRKIRKGEIVGDTIKIKSDYGFIHNYIKIKDWNR